MSTSGTSGHDKLLHITLVLFSVSNDPSQGTAAVFYSGRSQGNASEPVFDVDHSEAHLEKRQNFQLISFLTSRDPAAAVEVDYCGIRGLQVKGQVEIQLRIEVIGG
jgi:hypothetical protein